MIVSMQRALMIILVLGAVALPDGIQRSGDASAQTRNEKFEKFKKTRAAKFKSFQEEFEAYKNIVREERAKYLGKVDEKWDEPTLSSEKVWVEYSEDLEERHTVDFENRTVTIEISASEDEKIDAKTVREKLTELVAKDASEVFADDNVAQAIEKRSIEELPSLETAEVPPVPVLLSYLTGQAESAMQYVSEIVDHMMDNMTRSADVNSKGETVEKFEVPLAVPAGFAIHKETESGQTPTPNSGAPDSLPNEARPFWDQVVQYADEAKVEKSLVYAVIQTESAFDPMATSHIPAYGLMQIVPGSAGKDVTQRLFGKARILAPSYLYVPQKNIQAGATYLSIVYHTYLRKIKDPRSRVYCSIAAYNTGAGNVARAFTGNTATRPAVEKINQMTSQQVYDHLLANLPHDETKKYLERVSRRMTKFAGMGI